MQEATLSSKPTESDVRSLEKTTTHSPNDNSAGSQFILDSSQRIVTARALLLGFFLAAGLAWLNCYVETLYNVHFVGGIQMPFAAVFVLLFLILGVNLPLRALHRVAPATQRLFPSLSVAELVTVYVMSLFAALISTPGCDNHFLVTGPGLFYFSTRENDWANMFYSHVPSWFAPGWNGKTFQEDVINPFFLGGLTPSEIPWHAWAVMLTAWTIFLMLVYSLLFFVALLFRRQWIEYEALTFPLVELPLRMVETDDAQQAPPSQAFWGNRLMWSGFALAAFFHFLRGMYAHYPDWPNYSLNLFDTVKIEFTERPWNAIPPFNISIYWGAIGLAYLLTREISLSFWFFFLFMLFEYVAADTLGFPVSAMDKAGIMGRPPFIIYQAVGAWVMMAVLLVWTAREHLKHIVHMAINPARMAHSDSDWKEPFSARFILLGFVLSLVGLFAWTSFAGINLFYAGVFLAIFLITSLVLTRLVIEGGFLFPQAPFLTKQWMTNGLFGTNAIGPDNLTKLAFLEPNILYDMRTNTLPAFLHTLKIADTLGLERRNQRRLLFGVALAIVITFAVTTYTSLVTLYSQGALIGYGGSWGKYVFRDTGALLKTQAQADPANFGWMAIGAAVVWFLVTARSRLLWFPLHPLGFIAAPAYPITQLWFSFFAGWLIKSAIMKYGGTSSYNSFRPFMIGLIFGNLAAMVFWMIVGFWTDNQLQYWPA